MDTSSLRTSVVCVPAWTWSNILDPTIKICTQPTDTLSCWWYTYPSEKIEFVSWDDYSIPMGSHKNVPNHQPVIPSCKGLHVKNPPRKIMDFYPTAFSMGFPHLFRCLPQGWSHHTASVESYHLYRSIPSNNFQRNQSVSTWQNWATLLNFLEIILHQIVRMGLDQNWSTKGHIWSFWG